MPKSRLPHEFAPVVPETLREAEDLRRYGDKPVSQIIHMPLRAHQVRASEIRREQMDRLEAMDVLRGIVQEYGADRVRTWVRNIEKTPSTLEQAMDDQAAGEEIQ
jgi:hypothetical protein